MSVNALRLDHRAGTDASPAGPKIALRPGTLIRLGADGALATRLYLVGDRLPAFGSTPSRVTLTDLETRQPSFVTDVELAWRAKADEFAILLNADGTAYPVTVARADYTPEQEAYCSRCDKYVQRCLSDGGAGIRSRRVLVPIIAKVAAEIGEKPPGFTSVLRYIDRWNALGEAHGDGCYVNARNPGNRHATVMTGRVATAVEMGCIAARSMPKGTAENALKIAENYLLENDPGIDLEKVMPSLRTVSRHMYGMNRYVGDSLRIGERDATNKHRAKYERRRPEMPLLEVQCDHTTFDIILVDDSRRVAFGRPSLITFRDRCSGCCLGMSLSFNVPSYAAFLAGLKHAMSPKDMSEYPDVQNAWFAHGRFRTLWVDNGLEFIGENIKNAGKSLHFDPQELPVKSPWMKGAEERLFRILNTTAHNLPGTTLSNALQRKSIADLERTPVLTIGELRGFLTHYICDIYHQDAHDGLGLLGTLKGVPWQIWEDGMRGHPGLPPPPPDKDFAALAGDVDLRGLDDRGIRWDHIRYESDALTALRVNPAHRPGRDEEDGRKRPHRGTRYKVTRDPFDLGRIWVTNPFPEGQRTIEVPACRLDYASGLTLHQHQLIVKNADAERLRRSKDREGELQRAKRTMMSFVTDLMELPSRKQVERRLARFLERGASDHRRSVVTLAASSSAVSREHLDPADPVGVPAPAPRSPDAVELTSPPAPPRTEAESIETSADDLPKKMDRGAARMGTRGSKSEEVVKASDASSVRDRKKHAKGWK